jgi:hypothetical protein
MPIYQMIFERRRNNYMPLHLSTFIWRAGSHEILLPRKH